MRTIGSRPAAVFAAILLFFATICFVGCDYGKTAENSWFSVAALKRAGVQGLPALPKENSRRFTGVYGERFFGNVSEAVFTGFLFDSFAYIAAQFDHAGYRGEQTGSFFGGAGNYNVYDREDIFEYILCEEDDYGRTITCNIVFFDGDCEEGDLVDCRTLEAVWYSSQHHSSEADEESGFTFNCIVYLKTKTSLEQYTYCGTDDR